LLIDFPTLRCHPSVPPIERDKAGGRGAEQAFCKIIDMSPSVEKDKRAVKLKPRRRGAAEPTEPKTYNLPFDVILEIRKAASIYGSQGRAVQVGSELLVRLPKPIPVPQPDPEQIKRRTYKLSPRTIQVIEQLAESEYGDPGQVLAASMKILKVKKLSSKYLADSE
jgi:hypothetical protein